jgi:hypothetical protein
MIKIMDDKKIKALLGKLRQPIHINYIATYILRDTMENTIEVINNLIEEGVVEESKYAKNYYGVKPQENN